MRDFKTEQEIFWSDEFGNDYIDRNKDKSLIASCTKMFADIFSKCTKVNSVIEIGANRGNNLIAINNVLPNVRLKAIEINKKAIEELNKIENCDVFHSSILEFNKKISADFVFTRGVLIHINPDELQNVYEKIYSFSQKYICVAEYYNPTPITIKYRGYENRLFKRDFAGELLNRFKDLKLIGYDFIYHKDNLFSQDDITWFLLEKQI